MKCMRLFLAVVLCMSLMVFAGCGANDTGMDGTDNGTVNEQTNETNNNDSSTDNSDLNGGDGTNSSTDGVTDGNSDGNVVGDAERAVDDGARSLGEAADDMKNDVKDAVNGRDRTDAGTKTN